MEWISDLKRGVCLPEFWLSHAMCCRGLEPCPNWLSWSDFIPNASAAGAFIFNYFVFFLGSVTFATICAWLVKVYAPMAAGSGIPEVKTILGGFVITKFLGGWTLLLKGTGLILSVASGLNLGKEGPLVHVACCIGNVMCRLFDKFHYNEVKKREALSAASAAGVAVAFGAPIGGVLFSLEVKPYDCLAHIFAGGELLFPAQNNVAFVLLCCGCCHDATADQPVPYRETCSLPSELPQQLELV